MAKEEEAKIRTSLRVKLLIGIVTVLLIALMFPKGESIESEVAIGSIWIHDDLIARFSFPILKDPEVYKAQIKSAKENIYPVYLKKASVGKLAQDSLKSYNKFLLRHIETSTSKEDSLQLNPTFLSYKSFKTLQDLAKENKNKSIANAFNSLIFTPAEEILENAYSNNIIDTTLTPSLNDSIAIRTGNIDQIENMSNIDNTSSIQIKADATIHNLPLNPEEKKALSEYINHFIFANVIYDQGLTNEETNQAVSNVSRYSGIVNENERIIAKHDRITKEAKLKIDSYKAAKGDQVGSEGSILQFLGKILHISSLLTLIIIYLFLFRKKIFHDNLKVLLLAINFIFISFIAFLINQVSVDFPLQFLIFVPVFSMLVTIIFDSRVGFYSTVITVLILGALRSNDYTFAAMNLFAGALSVFSVRDIKNRSQIFRSFLFILIGYLITILAFGFERFASLNQILIECAFAGTNALISPVLTYGLLIFFEKLFKITTDLTLVELSNFDRPLLKDLARRAPGTFNHSMTMGTLAEAAAESVKANPLLARVGAYYHDIGKTIMPQNFVENQLNNLNVHENLSPEESVSLIVKHVKEGIALGEEYGLPKEIIDFIPMHHGTTVISYFYDKAKKLYGEGKVDTDAYRYPGPMPNSKETAIVMLADGCESAVRSIEDPDPTKVENVIGNIIQTRIDEHQLDDAPITFYDLTRIKETFTNILVGQRHHRIRYPKQDELEKGADEQQE